MLRIQNFLKKITQRNMKHHNKKQKIIIDKNEIIYYTKTRNSLRMNRTHKQLQIHTKMFKDHDKNMNI